MSNSVAVEISSVSKSFTNKRTGKTLQALDDISLTIQQGEFFALLGPNGAGKSTLINLMAGLVKIDSGWVKVMNYDVVSEYSSSRQILGVVPQELVYDPFFSVEELLQLQSGYFGYGAENQTWIEDLLNELHLADKRKVSMHHLSGGMKRRALIAQALVHKPKVLVLDEPTAGVDVELRRSLWNFAQRLHRDGTTIILTTHYLEEAEELCDRMAILNNGKIVALDTKDNLLQGSKLGDGKSSLEEVFLSLTGTQP